jgi:hypothetical protein
MEWVEEELKQDEIQMGWRLVREELIGQLRFQLQSHQWLQDL